MKTIKGPAIFLAQFAGDAAPFNNQAATAFAAHDGAARIVAQINLQSSAPLMLSMVLNIAPTRLANQ